MKQLIITIVFILIGEALFSQKMMTRSGEIKFEASMPSLEEIAAINGSASCILEKKTGDFVALALVKSFKFKSPLMEEHFNENYLESSKFPKSTFKGKILNFDSSKLTTTKTNYELEGELTIHGVTNKIKTKITLYQNADKLIAISNFSVKPKDYNIKIPSLVKNKIAENIKIEINFILEGN